MNHHSHVTAKVQSKNKNYHPTGYGKSTTQPTQPIQPTRSKQRNNRNDQASATSMKKKTTNRPNRRGSQQASSNGYQIPASRPRHTRVSTMSGDPRAGHVVIDSSNRHMGKDARKFTSRIFQI